MILKKKKYSLVILCLAMLFCNIVFAQLNHFTPVSPTGESDAIVIQSAVINGIPIRPGDEVAVFDSTLCVGATTFTGTYPIGLSAWIEYEPPGQDKLPGARCDRSMIFKIWQKSSNIESEGKPIFISGCKFCNPLTVVSLLSAEISEQVLSVSDETGAENVGAMIFTVFLSIPSDSDVRVDYQTFDDTAVAPGDYTTTAGFLIFSAGETSKTIYVPIIDDDIEEGSETFKIVLSNPVNASIADNEGIGTINDDDVTAVTTFDEIRNLNFELSQNYPNPFNPETTIHFQLREDSEVNLSIYDLAGTLIQPLVSGYFRAGNYNVSWDGRDEKNHQARSGVYLYRLNAGKFSAIKKMLLIK